MTWEGETATVTELEREVARLSDERHELFARLAELEAERTTQTMELFIMAAHELRTPLQSLIMANDLMVDRVGGGGEVEREWLLAHLRTQQGTLVRLHELIDAWFAAPRVRAGTLATAPEHFDLAELVRQVLERHANDLAWAGCPVELSLQPLVGEWDRMRIDTALTNLLTNAMKFGARQPIAISAAGDDETATLIVRDHGPGIAFGDQRRIFERFERLDGASRVPGFGIGLWMARALLRTIKGTLTVESEPGHGATFTIRLPRAS